MHELSIMKNILEIVLKYGEKAEAKKISRINLNIGSFMEFVPRYAQLYFDMISQNTIAEKAEIHIETIPAKIKCNSCGHETEIDIKHLLKACNQCRSEQIELISGRELQIDSIEIE
ncbi:MAG TPA: hydrogenase maturation nickel metallochaperone HypA [Syntrophomonas sp.]|nr:hydrogenase maturation nickel metallochaperone HypA [Syntrophomonas sp.]